MKLLANVQTYAKVKVNGVDTDTLVKDYRLTYDQSSSTQSSRLTGLTECERDGVCLPGTTLGWKNLNGSLTAPSTVSFPADWGSTARWSVGDFNGDGITDSYMWRPDGYLTIYLNHNDGSISAVNAAAGSFAWGDTATLYEGDFNGDGKTDIFMARPADNKYVLYTNAGITGSTINFNSSGYLTNMDWGTTAHWTIADFNGDGKSDLRMWRSDGYLTIYLSRGDGSFSAVSAAAGSFAWGDTATLYEGDFYGDGKTDIFMARPADNKYVLYTNAGISGGTINFTSSGYLSYLDWGTTARWTIADFNGDGKSDLRMWRPDYSNVVYYRYYVGEVGDSIDTLTTGLGTTTALAYKAITDNTIYSKDSGANAAVYPYRDLQVPMYVVSKATLPDGIGGTRTTNYFYTGAKSHLTGGGFMGFRQYDVTDVSTGIKTSTTFRQDYPLQGLPLSVTQSQNSGTGSILHSVANTWEVRTYADTALPLATANGNGTVIPPTSKHHFPMLTHSVEITNELSGSLVTKVTSHTTYDGTSDIAYDGYGNAATVTTSTTDGSTPNVLSKLITNTYATPDLTKWLLGRLTRSTVQSTSP